MLLELASLFFFTPLLWHLFPVVMQVTLPQLLVLLAVLSTLHAIAVGALFGLAHLPSFRLDRKKIVAAVFCGSHKTVALGIPLLRSIYGVGSMADAKSGGGGGGGGGSKLALLSCPLLLYHPMQLVIGSYLVPHFRRFIALSEEPGP